MVETLIRNGRVYDGTGSDWFGASVAIEKAKVQLISGDTSSLKAKRVIDATGKIVCPGFVDMHAHSTMVILEHPEHEPKVRQGVTTELIGVDGNSYAPFLSAEDLRNWGLLNGGLDGHLPENPQWLTVDEYLSQYDRRVAVNIAYVIGNAPLRISSVGWNDRPPSDSEVKKMLELLRSGMRDGAFGMSTGLTYPPGSYATSDEIATLCEVVRDMGGVYVTHIRYGSGDGFIDPNLEALDVGRRTGVPVHVSHFASTWKRNGQFRPLLRLVEDATADGVDVTFDAYPYVHTGSRALVMIPEWTHEGGPQALLARLRDPKARSRMRQETDPRAARWRAGDGITLGGFRKPQNKKLDGMTIGQIADELAKDPLDALCDLLLDENLGISEVGLYANNATNNRKVLAHSRCMVGSDALLLGDYPSPRSYGTFPKVLGDLVREEGLLSMADAIRKITSLPAQRLGLQDRGILRNGFAADLVVFDPLEIHSPATVESPRQFPLGISHVMVNGVLVIDDGEHTGALPGRALRNA